MNRLSDSSLLDIAVSVCDSLLSTVLKIKTFNFFLKISHGSQEIFIKTTVK